MSNRAIFTRGSTMRHVVAMTSASALGFITMFGVDMVDMYFLSRLGEQELAAAVGYAGTIIYFLVSTSIGLQIALGALVARAEGGRQRDLARRYCSSALLFSFCTTVVICLIGRVYLQELLQLLGATGVTRQYAADYAGILLPNMPVFVLGMSASAGVRAVGDARRSMWATIAGSVVNALLDPLFIFGFGWGLEGAAWASVAARCVVLVVAWHALHKVHRLPRRISWREFVADLRPILHIAMPAILTNLATPIGNGFVLRTMSRFGDFAVAGAAILGRVAPVALCAVFALSGAVGPIIGQNAGAGLYSRVRSTLRDALLFNATYVAAVWLLMWLAADAIVYAFSASGPAGELILFYCHFLVGAYCFTGTLFVANAAFNNLHHPHWATGFNFGRALLGTIPAVYFGAQWFGARGVISGEAVGSCIFGLWAAVAAFALVARLAREHVPLEITPRAEADEVERPPPV